MSFLHPGLAVTAVAVAALPVVLHLLLRRPRPTAWPSNLLLQRAMDRLRRRRTLDRWILLALRVLALLLVGLGMAGPFAGFGGGESGPRRTWIVIDDGATSAERLGAGVTSLDRSRQEAIRRLDGLHEGDQAGLVVAGRPVRVVVRPTSDMARVRQALQELTPRATPTDLPSAMSACVSEEAPTLPTEVLLASGWRRGSVRGSEATLMTLGEAARRARWIAVPPIEAVTSNRHVADAVVERVAETISSSARTIRVRIARSGDRPEASEAFRVTTPSGEIVARGSARWTRDSDEISIDASLRDASVGACMVTVDEDAQPVDDACAVVWQPRVMPRVWVVGRTSEQEGAEHASSTTWIVEALESAGLTPQTVDPASLALRTSDAADAVVVCRPDLVDAAGWAWLGRFRGDGGTVLLMPATDRPEQPWMIDASRTLGVDMVRCGPAMEVVTRLAASQPRSDLLALLGAEIDVLAEPVHVTRRIDLAPLAAGADTILKFDDGRPAMLMLGRAGFSGILLILAMPPELGWTDLPLKPMMVPLVQESVRSGTSLAATRQRLVVGQVASFGPSARGGLLVPATTAMGGTIEIDDDGRTRGEVPSPGLWKLQRQDGSSSWHAARLDPADADVARLERQDLLSWVQVVGDWSWSDEKEPSVEAGVRTESPWTWWFMLAGLACLCVESPWSRRGSPRGEIQETAA